MKEREGLIDSIYLDFKKAFDRVSHQRLIWKLGNRGGIKGHNNTKMDGKFLE